MPNVISIRDNGFRCQEPLKTLLVLLGCGIRCHLTVLLVRDRPRQGCSYILPLLCFVRYTDVSHACITAMIPIVVWQWIWSYLLLIPFPNRQQCLSRNVHDNCEHHHHPNLERIEACRPQKSLCAENLFS
jgi:hypothetical protein